MVSTGQVWEMKLQTGRPEPAEEVLEGVDDNTCVGCLGSNEARHGEDLFKALIAWSILISFPISFVFNDFSKGY